MSAIADFLKSNIIFDICLAVAIFIFICNYVILRRINKKSEHFVSGIPLAGPVIYAAGAVTTPCKWLALFALLDPQILFLIKSIPDIIKSGKEDKMKKKYLLLKLEDIKKKDAPLIAELRDIRVFTAVYTEGAEIENTEEIKTIKPPYCLTASDKNRALDTLLGTGKLKADDIIVMDKINEKNLRTERVRYMESLYDKALAGKAKKYEIKILDKYLSNGFKGDFEADEKGMFPQDLKRGVLSEDGLYDLLEDLNG